MKTFLASTRWLTGEQCRLDASAYAEGGQAVRAKLLQSGTARRLSEVADVFSEARFARTYVGEASRGYPYVTGSDMLALDLKGLLYISRARTPQAARLQVQEGWTLVSCSGTVGRTVYCRPDMEGVVVSHDVIRLRPKSEEVPPGYLYAFMSSRHAQAMLRQKAYGSVIQHIEPIHIRDLPIAMMDDPAVQTIDRMIREASAWRCKALELLSAAESHMDLASGYAFSHVHQRATGLVSSRSTALRLDAFHHVGWASEGSKVGGEAMGDLADVFSVSSMPRLWVEKGVPYATGANIFMIRPDADRCLAKWVAEEFNARVSVGDLLMQAYGQLYGLIGRCALIGASTDGWAASHLLFRIRAAEAVTRARIIAFVRSELGRRRVLAASSGNQIPHLVPGAVQRLRVPPLPDQLVSGILSAIDLRERADQSERMAIDKVEAWLDS